MRTEKFRNRPVRDSSSFSNLKDWNYIKRINGLIRLKERRLTCVENWTRGMDVVMNVQREQARKLKNYEEFVSRRQIESDK